MVVFFSTIPFSGFTHKIADKRRKSAKNISRKWESRTNTSIVFFSTILCGFFLKLYFQIYFKFFAHKNEESPDCAQEHRTGALNYIELIRLEGPHTHTKHQKDHLSIIAKNKLDSGRIEEVVVF